MKYGEADGQHTIHECLRSRRTPRNVNVDRHDPVAPTGHTITVMIISASICAASHADDPSRLWHLVVDLPESGGHLIGECAGNNHDIRLSRGSAENYSQTILVVSRCAEMHHLYGAAGKTECHGPKRALTSPIGYLVDSCAVVGA